MPVPSNRRALLLEPLRTATSSSFGVVNMHLMSWPADRIVIAWSMQCSLYASRCSIQPFLISLIDPARIEIDAEADAAADTGPGARPPAAAAAGRDGPSISQFAPLGKYLSGSVSLNIS